MEMISIAIGMIFWPGLIAAWVLVCRRRRARKVYTYLGAWGIGAIALLCALSLGHYVFIDEPMATAAMRGDASAVKRYLRLGANPNTEFEGSVPLVEAATHGYTEVVRLLVAHGAKVDARDGWTGKTALRMARGNHHSDVVAILLGAGAKE